MIAVVLMLLAAEPALPALRPELTAVAPSLGAVISTYAQLDKDAELGWLSESGLALDGPAYGFAHAGEGVAVLRIAKREGLDASFDRAIKAKRAKALATKDGERAIELVTKRARLVLVRAGEQLYVSRSASMIERARLVPAPSLEPPAVVSREKRKPLMWFVARPEQAVERVEGAVFAEGKTIEVRADLWLDFTTGLLIADLAVAQGSSRRLIDVAGAVAEVTGFAGSSVFANIFSLEQIPPVHANTVSGVVHAQLTRGGSIVLAIEAREGASEAELEGLRAAIAKRYEFTQVTVVKPRLVVAIVEGRDAKALKPAAVSDAAKRAQIELSLKAPVLLEGLEARTKSRQGPRLLRPELAVLKDRGEGLLQRTEAARVELSFGPATVGVRAVLELR
jgi:hypothetical protein